MFESEGPRVRTKRMCKGVRTDSCTTEASVGAPLPPTANLYTYKLKKAMIPTRHSAHARDVPALPLVTVGAVNTSHLTTIPPRIQEIRDVSGTDVTGLCPSSRPRPVDVRAGSLCCFERGTKCCLLLRRETACGATRIWIRFCRKIEHANVTSIAAHVN